MHKPYTYIIKAQWDKHLKLKLHATTYWFNHAFRYNEKFNNKRRVIDSVVDLLVKRGLCENLTQVISEMEMYQDRQESFDRPSALPISNTIRPSKH